MRAAVLLLMVLAQVSDTRAPDGFLGNAWGTHISSMQEKFGLREIARTSERVTYASTIQRLGDADLEECNLEFVHNRLSGAVILATGRENADHLLLYFRSHFGEGRRYDPTAISWMAGYVRVSFDIDSYGDAYVYWYSLSYQ